MSRNDLNGKVVLIAGGAKNLGGLLSKTVASKGAKVVIHYNSDKTKAEAEQTLADIKNNGGESILIQGDLTNIANITNLFASKRSIWRCRYCHQHSGYGAKKTIC